MSVRGWWRTTPLPPFKLKQTMKAEEKNKTAATLTERSKWIRIGLLFIHLKPLTLGQIYEMGPYTSKIEGDNLNLQSRIIPSSEMFSRYRSAVQMQEIFLVCAFRQRWKRWLFRRYILKRLTLSMFQSVVEIITDACTANFFLTSIIFLRQTNAISEPIQTTARGQQSEE